MSLKEYEVRPVISHASINKRAAIPHFVSGFQKELR